jgi:hypothetical protein
MQRYDVGDRHPQAGPHRAQRGYRRDRQHNRLGNDPAARPSPDRHPRRPGRGQAPSRGPSQRGYLPVSHRLAASDGEQRVVFGANTFRAFVQMLAASTEQPECSIHGSPG